MKASEYYAGNAKRHGTPAEHSAIARSGKPPVNASECDHAISWLSQHSASDARAVLDIGCAQLDFLNGVRALFSRRVGIDIAQFDNWEDYPDVETVMHDIDAEPLPFGDGVFDAVVMLMVLEHVFDPFNAVREVRRVLSQDGRAVIAVPNIASLKHRITIVFGKMPITSAKFSFMEDSWDGYHLHNFTQASLNWLLKREGLKPMLWASQGRCQWLKQLRPSLFGSDLIVLCRPVSPNRDLPLKL